MSQYPPFARPNDLAPADVIAAQESELEAEIEFERGVLRDELNQELAEEAKANREADAQEQVRWAAYGKLQDAEDAGICLCSQPLEACDFQCAAARQAIADYAQ